MHRSFIFGIIFKLYNETGQNLKSDYVLGSKATSRVAIQRKTGSLLWKIFNFLPGPTLMDVRSKVLPLTELALAVSHHYLGLNPTRGM